MSENNIEIKQQNLLDSELKKDTINVGTSLVGALVGFAVGGIAGAVVGTTTSPSVMMAYNIINRAIERRKQRTKKVLETAFEIAEITPNEALLILESDESKTDDIISLLKIVAETDPNFDNILSSIIGENFKSQNKSNQERLLILADAIRNLRYIHIRILKSIFDAGGILLAEEMSNIVEIPIIELRSIVRDLELRGMIRDTGKVPIEWELRELGQMLIEFSNNKNI